jgi:hypothetical protein
MWNFLTKIFIVLDFSLKSKNQKLIHKLFDSMNEKTKSVTKRNSKNCI